MGECLPIGIIIPPVQEAEATLMGENLYSVDQSLKVTYGGTEQRHKTGHPGNKVSLAVTATIVRWVSNLYTGSELGQMKI